MSRFVQIWQLTDRIKRKIVISRKMVLMPLNITVWTNKIPTDDWPLRTVTGLYCLSYRIKGNITYAMLVRIHGPYENNALLFLVICVAGRWLWKQIVFGDMACAFVPRAVLLDAAVRKWAINNQRKCSSFQRPIFYRVSDMYWGRKYYLFIVLYVPRGCLRPRLLPF